MLFILCVSVVFLCSTTAGFSWGRHMKPSCVPTNLLCAYTEECCGGVCAIRTYFRIIKIKLCTPEDWVRSLSPLLAPQAKNLSRAGRHVVFVQQPDEMYPGEIQEIKNVKFQDDDEVSSLVYESLKTAK